MLYKDRLVELREEKELKQQELAKIIGMDNSVFSKYEKEYVIIPIKHLNTLCNFFRVSFDYVFGFTSELNYDNSKVEIDPSIVGERLKEFRREHGLTQEKLASILNMARSALANYERGRNIVATPFLYTICSKYHVSADYLLGKIDEKINLK